MRITERVLITSVGDPDPEPDPLVRGMDPDPASDPDPSLFLIKVLSGLK
jgi:hypothetical protein